MTPTPAAAGRSRVVLVTDTRRDPGRARVRRYRLGRLAADERPAAGDRLAQLKRPRD